MKTITVKQQLYNYLMTRYTKDSTIDTQDWIEEECRNNDPERFYKIVSIDIFMVNEDVAPSQLPTEEAPWCLAIDSYNSNSLWRIWDCVRAPIYAVH